MIVDERSVTSILNLSLQIYYCMVIILRYTEHRKFTENYILDLFNHVHVPCLDFNLHHDQDISLSLSLSTSLTSYNTLRRHS